ncbi:hypothetical protein [Streptomyces angustmyceticus]|uniref:hypothetical protein n=1 Tax=Streptomyces angustmyceticus TaxID=285578 RepID=UPI0021AFF799|nr:hypothetical protein [Streptomyces angustmyceticus]
MNWDNIALLVLALSGTLSLLLSQVRDVLSKTAEVITAWQEVRRCLQRRAGDRSQQDPPQD